MIAAYTDRAVDTWPDEPTVVGFAPGPCDDPGVRRRFIREVRRLFAEARRRGVHEHVDALVERIAEAPSPPPGALVAAYSGDPRLLVLPLGCPGPQIGLGRPPRSARAG